MVRCVFRDHRRQAVGDPMAQQQSGPQGLLPQQQQQSGYQPAPHQPHPPPRTAADMSMRYGSPYPNQQVFMPAPSSGVPPAAPQFSHSHMMQQSNGANVPQQQQIIYQQIPSAPNMRPVQLAPRFVVQQTTADGVVVSSAPGYLAAGQPGTMRPVQAAPQRFIAAHPVAGQQRFAIHTTTTQMQPQPVAQQYTFAQPTTMQPQPQPPAAPGVQSHAIRQALSHSPSASAPSAPANPQATQGYSRPNQSWSTTSTAASSSNAPAQLATASSGSDQLLDKKRLDELVKEVDPHETLEEDVKDALLQLTDEFVDKVLNDACRLAKHRDSDKLEAKDVQLVLERNWNMWIPGFGTDESRPYKKAVITDAHKQRMALIKKTLKKP
uniref:Transcription initiation factor TFIID subunit 12 n=1 Tax=Plectus sambesii TaxID=2011161 RepID=A0A914V6L8_9BILA